MPTQHQSVTSTAWVNIKSTLSLADGIEYAIQNTGGSSMYLTESDSPPEITDEGHILSSRKVWSLTPESGQDLYVRSISGQTIATITEAE